MSPAGKQSAAQAIRGVGVDGRTGRPVECWSVESAKNVDPVVRCVDHPDGPYEWICLACVNEQPVIEDANENRETEAAYEAGRRAGYEEGFKDGRRD